MPMRSTYDSPSSIAHSLMWKLGPGSKAGNRSLLLKISPAIKLTAQPQSYNTKQLDARTRVFQYE